MPATWRDLAEHLTAEWDTLVAATPATTLTRWGRTHPPLAGLESLNDIETRILANVDDYLTRDRILLALIQLTQDGNQLAGRTVLHLLRRGISNLVSDMAQALRRADAHHSNQDVGEQILGAFWEVLATYPTTTRPNRVAANLLQDTRRVVISGNTTRSCATGIIGTTAHRRREVLTADPPESLATPADEAYLANNAPHELTTLLAWATRQHIITDDEQQLLRDICTGPRSSTQTYAYRSAAAIHGLTPANTRQRTHRILERLQHATAHDHQHATT